MQPTDRASFIQYCKNRLGEPVINVELADTQCDALVDDALQLFREYHFDATQREFLKVQITQQIIDQKYLPCPEDILSVVRIVKLADSNYSLFDLRYQLQLRDFYTFSNVSMQNYVITLEKLALMDWLLNPEPVIRFSRYTNKIHLDIDWNNQVKLNDYLIVEVYRAISETEAPKIWQDRWLKKYATALMKQQWGSNLKKFGNVQMLGGVTLNGQQIFDEATLELEQLEDQLHNDYQAPPRIFLG
jgi:hypothetical protein